MGFAGAISFFVEGEPGTKGSVKAFAIRIKGTKRHRAVVVNDSAKAKPWAALVSAQADRAMKARELLLDPVEVNIVFYLKRPKSHFRKNGELKPNAPTCVATKPDGDKLVRCAWDALTGHVFKDDCQIVKWSGCKLYSNDGRSGARFSISPMNRR